MKYLYILFIVTGLMGLSSCDLDRNPYDSLTSENIEKDFEGNIEYLLNGSYSALKGWSDGMHRLGEYPADNVLIRNVSTDSFFDFISYNHMKDNGRINNHWYYSYKAIVQANDIINALNEKNDPKWDETMGQAYYIRGLSYFYLTIVFGRPYYDAPDTNLGVPINLASSPTNISEVNTPNRSTVKESYAQAIRDLRKAEKLMVKDRTASYATKEAAQALLSKVYLYMSGTYDTPNVLYADSTIYYANKVLESSKFKLLPREAFMKFNTYAPDDAAQTETVFAVKRVSAEFSGSYGSVIGSMYATIQGQGWGEMYATAKYMDLLKKAGYQKQDARWAFIDPQYLLDKNGGKTQAFRFISKTYQDDEVTQRGYAYVQGKLLQKADGTYYIERIVNPGENQTIVEHPLTEVSAGDNLYSIVWSDGQTYVGEKDYEMALNMTHPMFYITKCSLQSGESHLYSPVVSRLGELYLNMAEAYAKKGEYSKALENVNVIRQRAVVGGGYSSTDFTPATASQLIDEERQLELAFEGHRAYDVFRNGGTMTRPYPGAHDGLQEIKASNPRVVNYIPQKEIDAYPGPLTQNPD